MNLVEVKIGALLLDPNNNSPIVVLKGISSENILPIWVGPFEANAIASEIEKSRPNRPMPHDLFRTAILISEATIEKVVITKLRRNTFFAKIQVTGHDGDTISIDARPSDAIAISLRMDSPIFVNKNLFSATQNIGQTSKPEVILTDAPPNEDWPAEIA